MSAQTSDLGFTGEESVRQHTGRGKLCTKTPRGECVNVKSQFEWWVDCIYIRVISESV